MKSMTTLLIFSEEKGLRIPTEASPFVLSLTAATKFVRNKVISNNSWFSVRII